MHSNTWPQQRKKSVMFKKKNILYTGVINSQMHFSCYSTKGTNYLMPDDDNSYLNHTV